MIDSNTVDQIVRDPRRDLGMRRIEHVGILHPDGRKVADSEEPPVPDQARIPRHQPIRLPIMDLGSSAGIGARCDGKPFVVVGDHRFRAGSVDGELARVVTRSQYGKRDLSVRPVVGRGIEVEEVRVLGLAAAAEASHHHAF